MIEDLKQKCHTITVSDLHLSDAEPIDPRRPLWKRFRRKKYFIDRSFSQFLTYMQKQIGQKPIELVLNGDIFDFDSVMSYPKVSLFPISHYEKNYGLNSLEEKSVYKIAKILQDHAIWTEAISNFINSGNNIVFIIGNHDVELNWPKVQQMIIEKLKINEEHIEKIRFCEWFYISEEDSLIEHGNQYDPYCLCLDPINPIIQKKGEYKMRLPFGNLANRFMINRMGLKNPHCDDAFLKTTFEFITFFYKYEMRIQPLMLFTWFFGALRTLIYSLSEGNLPSQKDPLTFADKVKSIATRSKTSPEVVLIMKENQAHPAVMKPFMILRELWLDRAFLIMAILWGCWQIFTTSALFANISVWWFLVPLFIFIPFFIYYSHGVQSDVHNNARLALEKAPLSAKAAGVKRIIHGHTHHAQHKFIQDGLEYLNTGAWTPVFEDPECLKPRGEKLFAWLNPDVNSNGKRILSLYKWDNGEVSLTRHTEEFIALPLTS